jgi:hypothetical protein
MIKKFLNWLLENLTGNCCTHANLKLPSEEYSYVQEQLAECLYNEDNEEIVKEGLSVIAEYIHRMRQVYLIALSENNFDYLVKLSEISEANLNLFMAWCYIEPGFSEQERVPDIFDLHSFNLHWEREIPIIVKREPREDLNGIELISCLDNPSFTYENTLCDMTSITAKVRYVAQNKYETEFTIIMDYYPDIGEPSTYHTLIHQLIINFKVFVLQL